MSANTFAYSMSAMYPAGIWYCGCVIGTETPVAPKNKKQMKVCSNIKWQGKGLHVKTTVLLVFFLWSVKSLKNLDFGSYIMSIAETAS